MARIVRTFKPQFAPLVEAGTKLQTVRPVPKRMPEAGDQASLRAWTGRAYWSAQRVLREVILSRVREVTIHATGQIELAGRYLTTPEMEAFARADGFADLEALLAVVIDRLRGFQSGPYGCRENAVALTKIEEATMWLQKRTRDRMARGVEGTNKL